MTSASARSGAVLSSTRNHRQSLAGDRPVNSEICGTEKPSLANLVTAVRSASALVSGPSSLGPRFGAGAGSASLRRRPSGFGRTAGTKAQSSHGSGGFLGERYFNSDPQNMKKRSRSSVESREGNAQGGHFAAETIPAAERMLRRPAGLGQFTLRGLAERTSSSAPAAISKLASGSGGSASRQSLHTISTMGRALRTPCPAGAMMTGSAQRSQVLLSSHPGMITPLLRHTARRPTTRTSVTTRAREGRSPHRPENAVRRP